MSEFKRHKLRKGLNLPITGEPNQKIQPARDASTVALLGDDYVGMKPTMLVKEGDSVQIGQPLFEDKKNPGVIFTSPAAGKVQSINRGEKRAFKSIVISCGSRSAEKFPTVSSGELESGKEDKIREILVKSGLWTAIRTRPFSRVPAIDSRPSSIFVSAMDTNALSPDPYWVINEHATDFENGLKALGSLTKGKVFVGRAPGSGVQVPATDRVKCHEFKGPHPAGLIGTHIHLVDPVNENKTVWHVGYQDVIAIGKLLLTGELWTERVVALAGPKVKNPRLIKARLGACIDDLIRDELEDGAVRVISGPLLSGHNASKFPVNFLGRYHNQISVIEEDDKRELLGWQMPGFEKFSTRKVYASTMFPGRKFPLSSATHGSKRAMVPIGMYEDVVPLDIIPTYLLRSLVSQDLETAVKLGVLELDEEDLGLCTFVCPGKTEYGPLLRNMLTTIEKEG